ncbi:MAG: HD domain-containing protein [Desulfovibrionales bacterium]|nr:MAG: HD domain-containing protein [Desulfovibrionales bacterium]
MTSMDEAVQDLVAFAQGLFPGDPLHHANMALKLDHCLRVFHEAEAITAAENLSSVTTRRALWAALFHDVGRFEQYVVYKTFDDRKSTDHGRLGSRTLKRHGLLDRLDAQDGKAVRMAVVLHNKRFLPTALPAWVLHPVQVVRDADKLDILLIMLDHLRPGGEHNPVVTLGLCDEPDNCSSELVDQILDGELGDYAKMRTLNDFRLLLCSWVHDLNYSATRQAIRQRGYLTELLSGLPDTPKIRRIHDSVLSTLE